MQKHVVHLASTHFTFDTRIFHKECVTLAKAGYKVTLLVQAVPPEQAHGMYSGVEVMPLPQPPNRLARLTQLTHSQYSLAASYNADLYHVHDWELLPWAAFLQWRTGTPVIFDRHEYYVERFRETPHVHPWLRPFISKAYKLTERVLGQRLAGIIAVNSEMARSCHRFNRNVISVYNYPKRQLAERVPDVSSSNTVIYIGAMGKQRGYKILLEAMTLFRQQIPEANALLLGWLEPCDVRARYIDNEEMWLEQGGIRIVDKVPHDEVFTYLDGGTVAWIPWLETSNNTRGTPAKLFEYMAAGKPVVASRMGFIEKYVSETECGILVEPGNAQMHADAILCLLTHPDEARRMGENGRQAVLQQYNWEKESEKLLAFYRQLLSERNPDLDRPVV